VVPLTVAAPLLSQWHNNCGIVGANQQCGGLHCCKPQQGAFVVQQPLQLHCDAASTAELCYLRDCVEGDPALELHCSSRWPSSADHVTTSLIDVSLSSPAL
jgi:hypothetical protein